MTGLPASIFTDITTSYFDVNALLRYHASDVLNRSTILNKIMSLDFSDRDMFSLKQLGKVGSLKDASEQLRTRVITEILNRLHTRTNMPEIIKNMDNIEESNLALVLNPNMTVSEFVTFMPHMKDVYVSRIINNDYFSPDDLQILQNSNLRSVRNKTYEDVIRDSTNIKVYTLQQHLRDIQSGNTTVELSERNDLTENQLIQIFGDDWSRFTIDPGPIRLNNYVGETERRFKSIDRYLPRYINLIVPDYIRHKAAIRKDNPVFSLTDYKQFPELPFAGDRSIYHNPNFSFEDLKNIIISTEDTKYADYSPIWDNINLTFEDIIPYISANNRNTKDIITRLLTNVAFDMNDCSDMIHIYMKNYPNKHLPISFVSVMNNPNFTLSFLNHPKIGSDIGYFRFNFNDLNANKFTKDPDYRTLAYRYIYRILPKVITLEINGTSMQLTKQQAYGTMAAVKVLKLSNKYTFKYAGVLLDPEDYRMFDKNTAEQPFVVKIREIPFFYTNDGFLQGVKGVYVSNNIPFDIIYTMDKEKGYRIINLS